MWQVSTLKLRKIATYSLISAMTYKIKIFNYYLTDPPNSHHANLDERSGFLNKKTNLKALARLKIG
ncbi:hypothetical protein YSY43_24980 [Paenibacillus sp. YSY-4.3]